MFHLTKYALVVVFIYAPSGTFGKVSLESVEVKTYSSITCRFDVDIKIEFISETDDKRYTIAECKTSEESCYLLHQSLFGKHYAVSYQTGNVTLFNILNDVEETRGTYQFCETYNKLVGCVNVSLPIRNSTKNDTVENKYACAKDCSDNSATTTVMVIFIILLVCALGGTVIYIRKLRRKAIRLGMLFKRKGMVMRVSIETPPEPPEVPTVADPSLQQELNGPDHADVVTTATIQPPPMIPPVPELPARHLDASCTDEEFKRLVKEAWFFGVLPLQKVEHLLAKDGDFLVRESINNPPDEKYVLSVFWKRPHHIKIIKHENGWRCYEDVSETITELVNKYVENKKPIAGTIGMILSNPIQRKSWQLINDHIELVRNIGDNKIYEVFEGYCIRTVAVKKCKNTLSAEQRKIFLENGLKLNQYDHPNIVKFIGIAAQREPVMVIMEYMSGGSLLQYLENCGQKQSRLQAAIMCLNVANGMAYLSQKGYIHRELSAKRCLVGDRRVVKISPFETFRQEGEYDDICGNMKWTAPEAARRGTYTTMSDVWSFGVLMWEILSNGSEPYPTFSDNQTLIEIEKGYRMAAYRNTPDSIYKLMLKCWEGIPNNRITFQGMHKRLETLIRNPPRGEIWS